MNRKWLFAGALAAAIVGASSPALADDDCAGPYSRQDVYLDRDFSYGSGGYGYTQPYDSYDREYSYEGNYAPRYDGPRYGGYPQTGYPYSRPYYENRGGRHGYGGRTVHEDHTRTTFKPFPFPRIEKRVVHHEHPAY